MEFICTKVYTWVDGEQQEKVKDGRRIIYEIQLINIAHLSLVHHSKQ